jgi:hypothetical protein
MLQGNEKFRLVLGANLQEKKVLFGDFSLSDVRGDTKTRC